MKRAFLILASTHTTAVLVLLLSIASLISVVVPQGSEAVELARNEGSSALQTLFALGLTQVFESRFVAAIGVLLLGNIAAFLLVLGGTKQGRAIEAEVPKNAEFSHDFQAKHPENAAVLVRQSFVQLLGTPRAEKVFGERVVMVFESGPFSRFAPFLTHIGMLACIVSAGLYARTSDSQSTIVRAMLEVTHAESNMSGVFDMAEGEPFEFFQDRSKYILRGFSPDREGLGPAVWLEKIPPGQQRGFDFWVYQHAPTGFDARHRQDDFSIVARSMGRRPMPGAGLGDSNASAGLLLGVSLLFFGLVFGRNSEGTLFVEASRDRVSLFGRPRTKADPDFAAEFENWKKSVAAIEEL